MLSYSLFFLVYSYHILGQPFLTLIPSQDGIRAVLDPGNSETNIIVPLSLTTKTKKKQKMSFSNDEISNNMNQNQNNSSTITDEQILQIANMLRNGLGIQQIQVNLDKGQGWNRSKIVGQHPPQRHKEDKSHLHCTHCRMKKHTKETCFKIVGYPERWEDSKPKNRKAATAAVTHEGEKREKDTSLRKSDQWIFYCGATDTMTHDPHDFDRLSTLVKTHIETASGELVEVQGGGLNCFFRKIKIKKLSLYSCTIIKITFCKPSYKGAELCGSHVF